MCRVFKQHTAILFGHRRNWALKFGCSLWSKHLDLLGVFYWKTTPPKIPILLLFSLVGGEKGSSGPFLRCAKIFDYRFANCRKNSILERLWKIELEKVVKFILSRSNFVKIKRDLKSSHISDIDSFAARADQPIRMKYWWNSTNKRRVLMKNDQ